MFDLKKMKEGLLAKLEEARAEVTKYLNAAFLTKLVATAFYMSAADGSIDEAEVDSLVDYMSGHPVLKVYKAADVTEIFGRFYAQWQADTSPNHGVTKSSLKSHIRGIETDAEKQTACGLAFDILLADGKVDDGEIQVANRIVKSMSLAPKAAMDVLLSVVSADGSIDDAEVELGQKFAEVIGIDFDTYADEFGK
ncbi:MAG: tellurite resistance TerB family protein [bacterium]|nr:tellurite resistance TerB family protein [bacterium]